MAMKGKLRNQSSNKRKKKMNPLTQLKKNRGERAGTYKMKKNRSILMAALVSAVLLSVTAGALPVYGQAQAVRWDIIHFDPTTTPPTISAGGVAFASAISGSAPSGLKIEFTGSGTFVAPASGGTSGAVTGGGTWQTFSDCPATCVSTGSGTYQVTRLASWNFANFQSGSLIDLIDDGTRANGNAVLRIHYSDGSNGILGIGCHGPGAPEGIEEGIIATKGFVTYWTGEVPVPGVDADRTNFHVR
jgi:hypothetical protein